MKTWTRGDLCMIDLSYIHRCSEVQLLMYKRDYTSLLKYSFMWQEVQVYCLGASTSILVQILVLVLYLTHFREDFYVTGWGSPAWHVSVFSIRVWSMNSKHDSIIRIMNNIWIEKTISYWNEVNYGLCTRLCMFCGSVCREINHGFSNPLSVENELYQKNIKESELYDYVNTRKQIKEGFRGEFKVSFSLVELNCNFHWLNQNCSFHWLN